MINGGEIHKTANSLSVRPQQVEKDYIISWILKGISENSLLRDNLIFKGGTCLKKIHFEDYRFSEDMDFTLVDDSASNEELIRAFKNVFGIVYRDARIKLEIKDDKYETHESSGSIKFYIKFIGPLGGKGDEIKVDLSRGEQLEFETVAGNVYREYSDLEEEEFSILSYSLEEVLIEKMVALMGRTIPRDLYDFYYLTTIEGMDIKDVLYEFKRKAENKNHNPDEFVDILNRKEETYNRDWITNLEHQIKDLDKFKYVWRNVKKQMRKISV